MQRDIEGTIGENFMLVEGWKYGSPAKNLDLPASLPICATALRNYTSLSARTSSWTPPSGGKQPGVLYQLSGKVHGKRSLLRPN